MRAQAQIRILSLICAIPILGLAASIMAREGGHAYVIHGPLQIGHEDLSCKHCHEEAIGTTRQQLQAKLQYLLGNRESDVDFATISVSSETCLSCHDRPNERHPIYRFNEPRFVEALETIEANNCLGCHSEHTAERAFVEISFCSACHEDLVLEKDPLDVSHAALIKDGAWETCLGCHDFHGNHAYASPTKLEEAFAPNLIKDYLKQGQSPFGGEKLYEAKKPWHSVRFF